MKISKIIVTGMLELQGEGLEELMADGADKLTDILANLKPYYPAPITAPSASAIAISSPARIVPPTSDAETALEELHKAKAGKRFSFRPDGKDAAYPDRQAALVAACKAHGATSEEIDAALTTVAEGADLGADAPTHTGDDGGEII
jgi:hypothetical protein